MSKPHIWLRDGIWRCGRRGTVGQAYGRGEGLEAILDAYLTWCVVTTPAFNCVADLIYPDVFGKERSCH